MISRKNFLFCKTPSGAKATATVFSLIETAKANGLDPYKYLVYIFEKLSQDEDYDLEQLMPWTESVAGVCKAARIPEASMAESSKRVKRPGML